MKQYFLYILIFSSILGFSQGPRFTQYYAAPLLLNPALAGATKSHRAILNTRAQWNGLAGGGFNTGAFSYDVNLAPLRSGVGVVALFDQAGTARLRSSEIHGFYSYYAAVSKHLNFRLGLQGSFVSRDINYTNLVFADQFSGTRQVENNTADEVSNFDRVSYGDLGTGIIIYDEKNYWVGASLGHLLEPNQGFLNESVLPRVFSLHGGYNFYILKNPLQPKEDGIKITPSFLYQSQAKFDQLDVGAYLSKDQFSFGTWFRGIPFKEDFNVNNVDAVNFSIGYKFNAYKIGYSYDVTISSLGLRNTGGTHELSIIYLFDIGKEKIPVIKELPCPDFKRNKKEKLIPKSEVDTF